MIYGMFLTLRRFCIIKKHSVTLRLNTILQQKMHITFPELNSLIANILF